LCLNKLITGQSQAEIGFSATATSAVVGIDGPAPIRWTHSDAATSSARRADVTGFGVPEHHGDAALPMLVQSGNLSSLEI
jgi:hypothetical protein